MVAQFPLRYDEKKKKISVDTKTVEKTDDVNIVRMVLKDFLTGGDAAKKEEIKDMVKK